MVEPVNRVPSSRMWGSLFGLGAACVLCLAPDAMAEGPPGAAADTVVGASDASDAPTVADGPPPCAPAEHVAAQAVVATFNELTAAYHGQIPGPAGATIVERKVDALIGRVLDVDVFARYVLRGIWEQGSAEQHAVWRRALDRMLRRRYLKSLRSPEGHAIEVVGGDTDCDRAEVHFTLRSRRDAGAPERVVMALVYRREGWRAYDVTIDNVSLAHTWRSRFQRIFADGGVAAVDRQLREIDVRYDARD